MIAKIPVYMDGHDRAGVLRNERLDLLRVDRIITRTNIAKNRLETFASQCISRAHKGKRSGDDFITPIMPQFKGFNDVFERQMPIGKKRKIWRVQKTLQGSFEFAMLLPSVSKPPALPEAMLFQRNTLHKEASKGVLLLSAN